MLDVIVAMGGILATWALAGAGFVGIGLLTARLSGAASGPLSLARMFWWGWAASIVFLQAWHFALPVDGRAVIVLFVASAMGWITTLFHWRATRKPGDSGGRSTWAYLGLAATTLFVANLALGTPQNYDTGLYHLQAVRWNEQFAIVPGLGNLHGRLAFNNSSFLYAALFDVGPWDGRSHHLASGLLALAVLLPMVARVRGAFYAKQPRWTGDLFQVLLLPATLLFSYKQVTSYSPDLVIFLLGVVITSELWELLTGGDEVVADQWQRLLGIVLLSAAGVTVKLSFLPMAVVTAAVACAAGGIGALSPARKIVLAVVPLVILALFSARGIVLSGHPAYPQSWLAADVPWRVPPEQAQRDLDDIRAWARDREAPADEVLEGGGWVVAWAARQFRDVLKVTLPLLFFLLAGATLLRLRRRAGQPVLDRRAWALAPALATILCILAAAPDLSRFAGASVWILAAGATVLLLADLRVIGRESVRSTASRIVAVTTAALMAVGIVKAARYLNGPGEMGAFRPIPQSRLARLETKSGLAVWVPYRLPNESPHGEDQAWDAPLPSTPYFNPRLSLRQPDDLGSGFILDRDPVQYGSR